MKVNFKFDIGNRGLLQQELGLIDLVNATLIASALKHDICLKPDVFIEKVEEICNGKIILRVRAKGKKPIEVPLAV